jgi:hypothetical protein
MENVENTQHRQITNQCSLFISFYSDSEGLPMSGSLSLKMLILLFRRLSSVSSLSPSLSISLTSSISIRSLSTACSSSFSSRSKLKTGILGLAVGATATDVEASVATI